MGWCNHDYHVRRPPAWQSVGQEWGTHPTRVRAVWIYWCLLHGRSAKRAEATAIFLYDTIVTFRLGSAKDLLAWLREGGIELWHLRKPSEFLELHNLQSHRRAVPILHHFRLGTTPAVVEGSAI